MSDEFDLFWRSYPRHDSKKSAEKAFDAATKRFHPDDILKRLEVQKILWEDRKKEYWPYGASWLRATDFSDKPTQEPKTDPRKPDPRVQEILSRGSKPPDWEPLTVEELRKLSGKFTGE